MAAPAELAEVAPAAAAPVAVRSAEAAAAATVPTTQAAGVCVAFQASPPLPAVAVAPSPKPSPRRNCGRVPQSHHLASLPVAAFPAKIAFRFRSAVDIAGGILREFGQAHLVPPAADPAPAAILPFPGLFRNRLISSHANCSLHSPPEDRIFPLLLLLLLLLILLLLLLILLVLLLIPLLLLLLILLLLILLVLLLLVVLLGTAGIAAAHSPKQSPLSSPT